MVVENDSSFTLRLKEHPAQLKAFVDQAISLGETHSSLVEELKGKPESSQRLYEVTEPWCKLYEHTFVENLIYAFGRVPMLSATLAEAVGADDPAQALLDDMEAEPPPEVKTDPELQQQLFSSLGCFFCLGLTVRAFEIYGRPINSLVVAGKSGDDSAWFDAIRIDPTVMSLPAFAERHARASIFLDGAFQNSLRLALKGPTKRPMKQIGRIRLALWILRDCRELPLSAHELVQLFVHDLGFYAPGEDPAKALSKHMHEVMKFSTT
jgi:hypothetical protein